MSSSSAVPQFRLATGDDLMAVTALLEHAHLPVDGVAEMFATDASQFVIATSPDDSDAVIAVAGVEVCCSNALLRSVAVRDDWRRKGLGRFLVQRAVDNAEARGIHALYLLTLTAEHYFPRFGFEIVARDRVPPEIAATREFTSACPASAIVMTRPLHASPLLAQSAS